MVQRTMTGRRQFLHFLSVSLLVVPIATET